MSKVGKKYAAAKQQIEPRPYTVEDAMGTLKKVHFAKFNETIELHMRLGVDPKHADQMVRGTVVLPHGLGKSKTVCVIASGDKIKEAEQAGAEFVGGDDLVEKIAGGWMDFDACIATPDMMRGVGRLGEVLGPRGLMPNPKTGTVTMDVDKTGIIHAPIGKIEFTKDQLSENAHTIIDSVIKARPAAVKGRYVKRITVASTMSPGVDLDLVALDEKENPQRGRMKSKGKKKEELDALKKELSEAKNLFVAQFQGMTVAQDAELRHKVRDTKSKYRVVKNTLAKKAAEGTAAESVSKSFDGSTAIAYNASDPVSLAKALTAYAKANPLFVFKAGLVEGRVINLGDIAHIAAMPSKEELIAKLLFLINAPAQRIAIAVNGVARNLAVVLKQAVEQKKFHD